MLPPTKHGERVAHSSRRLQTQPTKCTWANRLHVTLTGVSEDFTLIFAQIWKRVNDHGKNWRHVYKVLTQVVNRTSEYRTVADFTGVPDEEWS